MRHALAVLVVLALGSACGRPEPRDEHRQIVVASRGADEAYDALAQALLQRFENLDASATSKEGRRLATTWRLSEEPDRLVRRRATGTVRWISDPNPENDRAVVLVHVEREISSKKTDFGELDRQSPEWFGGTDAADTTLEREILAAVQARLSGGKER